jgi:hypothetical protein
LTGNPADRQTSNPADRQSGNPEVRQTSLLGYVDTTFLKTTE